MSLELSLHMVVLEISAIKMAVVETARKLTEFYMPVRQRAHCDGLVQAGFRRRRASTLAQGWLFGTPWNLVEPRCARGPMVRTAPDELHRCVYCFACFLSYLQVVSTRVSRAGLSPPMSAHQWVYSP